MTNVQLIRINDNIYFVCFSLITINELLIRFVYRLIMKFTPISLILGVIIVLGVLTTALTRPSGMWLDFSTNLGPNPKLKTSWSVDDSNGLPPINGNIPDTFEFVEELVAELKNIKNNVCIQTKKWVKQYAPTSVSSFFYGWDPQSTKRTQLICVICIFATIKLEWVVRSTKPNSSGKAIPR